jgi:hypothetical protein
LYLPPQPPLASVTAFSQERRALSQTTQGGRWAVAGLITQSAAVGGSLHRFSPVSSSRCFLCVRSVLSNFSTFTYDSSQVSYLLRRCTSRSLCLIDEVSETATARRRCGGWRQCCNGRLPSSHCCMCVSCLVSPPSMARAPPTWTALLCWPVSCITWRSSDPRGVPRRSFLRTFTSCSLSASSRKATWYHSGSGNNGTGGVESRPGCGCRMILIALFFLPFFHLCGVCLVRKWIS